MEERLTCEIRLECLREAVKSSRGPEDVLYKARKYADFVLGTRDAEIIGAARSLAETVSGDGRRAELSSVLRR